MGISLSGGPFTYNRFNLTEGSKPDFLDMDKDGDKKESFKKAVKDKKDCGCKKEEDCDCSDKKKEVKENREMAYGGGKSGKGSGDGSKPKGITGGKTYTMKGKDGKPLFKEDATITKEDVIAHLIENNYVNNEVSAEVVFNSITDEFLELIESNISEGFMPLPKEKMSRQANKAYGKEQQAVGKGDAAGANKQMQRRNAMTDPSSRKQALFNKNANK